MKHRLQTLLRHKLQWLVLLTALLGVSQGVWAYSNCLKGSWDSWSEHSISNEYVTVNIAKVGLYDFECYDGYSTKYTANSTMTRSSCQNWEVYASQSYNTKIEVDCPGNYTFRFWWDGSCRRLSVTSWPSATYQVKGNWDNWNDRNFTYNNTTHKLEYTYNVTGSSDVKEFVIHLGDTYYKDGTFTRDSNSHDLSTSGSNNDKVTFDITGSYTFAWDGANLTIIYPCNEVAPTVGITTQAYSISLSGASIGVTVSNKGTTSSCESPTMDKIGVKIYSDASCSTQVGSTYQVSTSSTTATISVSGLSSGVQYWYKAYAKNNNSSTNATTDTNIYTFTTSSLSLNDIGNACGAGDYTLGATSNRSGSITYSVVSGGSGTASVVSGNILHVTVPGTVNVKATQAASGNYGAVNVTRTYSITVPPASGFAAVGQFNKDEVDPWEGSVSTESTAATGGYFADDHRTATLSTTQDANVFQWYGCDADGSNPTTTPANVTFSNSSTNTCTATFELPGTYYFLCKAGCSSADVASRVVQIDVPYPEMGISGPFFDGYWHHSQAGTDGLFSRKGLTWSKTFDCNTSDGKFVIIQRYKKGETGGDPAGWLGDSPDNKINDGTFSSLTGVERLSDSNYDFKSTIPCLASGNEVTFTVTMIAHDTYTVSLTKTKEAPENIYLNGSIHDGNWGGWTVLTHSSGSNVFTISFTTNADNKEFLLSTTNGNYSGKINACMDGVRNGWDYSNDSDHTSNFVASSSIVSGSTPITITVVYNEANDDFTMVLTKQCSDLTAAHSSTNLLLDEYSENVLCPGEKAKATMVSRKGYTYELFNGATSLGSNAGNGTTLSWKNLSNAGTYYVMATKSDDATCTGIVGTASQTINSSTVSVTASPGTSVVDFRPITLSKSASSTVDGDLTWAITAGSNGYLLLLSSKLPYDDRQRESVIFKGGPYGDTPSRAYTVTATGKKTVNIGDTDDKKTCESTATVNITLTAVPGCN